MSVRNSACSPVALPRHGPVAQRNTAPVDSEISATSIASGKLSSAADKAFGFQLRNDGNGPAHQGMLALLRDALSRDWIVNIDYDIDPGKKNGIIVRVWLTK
jgi:hypothetical protein